METADFVAWCYNAAKATQNPVYSWLAIQSLWTEAVCKHGPDNETCCDLTIPAWCAEYLGLSASRICALAHGVDFREEYSGDPHAFGLDVEVTSIGFSKAVALIPEALGLSNSGWHLNAFRAHNSDFWAIQAQAEWRRQYVPGELYTATLAKVVAATRPIKEESVIRKRVKEGRMFFKQSTADNDNETE